MPGFQEIDDQTEKEARAIRARLKDIEREAMKPFVAFDVKMDEPGKAEVTAKRLNDASVSAAQQGDQVKAIAALRVTIEVDDRCWEAYYNLGWHYLSLGKELHQPYMGKITVSDGESYYRTLADRLSFYEAALRYLQEAVRLRPRHAKGWCLLGQTQYYMADYDDARVSLQRAIEIDPTGEGGRMATETLTILQNSLK